MSDHPTYELVMYYTVEIGELRLESRDLGDAQRLVTLIGGMGVEGATGLNLVAWSGRSARDGGQPIGLILDQRTWGESDD